MSGVINEVFVHDPERLAIASREEGDRVGVCCEAEVLVAPDLLIQLLTLACERIGLVDGEG